MANEYGSFMDKANPDNEWTLRGCVIRFEPGTVNANGTFASGGPYIHANSGHIAVGVQGVSVDDAGYLVLDLDGAAITTILATPDETLTSRGIWCGPSGAAGTTKFRFYRVGTGALDLSVQSHWNHVAGDLSNVWLAWLVCTTRGTGQPAKSDQALTELAVLQAVVAAQAVSIDTLAGRVDYLESLQTPGSFGRFDVAKEAQTIGDLDAAHAGDTFGDFDAAYEQI